MPFTMPSTHRAPARLLAFAVAVATVLAMVVAQPAWADAGREWHVAPDGDDDGAGTATDPWRTLHLSMGKVAAGDTLVVHGGRYDERIGNLKPLPRGTADAPITMRAAAGEIPVIVGGMTLQLGGAHHWTFDGLTFAWSDTLTSGAALVRMVDGEGWRIQNSTISGNRSYTALRVMAENPGQATGWTIADNCIHTTIPTNAQNNDHNIYVGADSRYGVAPGPGVIERNIVAGAANGSNIKLGAGEPSLPGTSGVIVRDNVLAEAPHNVVVAWKSHDNRIENNVLFQRNNGTWSEPWYPNVRGLDLTGGGNLAVDNTGHAEGGVVESWRSAQAITDRDNELVDFVPSPPSDPCVDLAPFVGGADQIGDADTAGRVSGSSRTSTAAQLAALAYDQADTVVIARSDDYADALAGAPLAGLLGAPLLLTASDALSPEAADQINALDASSAVLLGGTGALSNGVAQDLRGLGLDVSRLSGANRFETAAVVMGELPASSTVFVVEGANADPARGWPDAVALSPLAARTHTPILLTTTNRVPDATLDALATLDDDVDVTIVGGEAAVSDAAAAAMEQTASNGRRSVARFAGRDRYETSNKLAESGVDQGADAGTLWVVTGLNWPDALAAGPAAAAAGVTMLFVHGRDAERSPTTLQWIHDHVADTADSLMIIGGPGAVTPLAVAILAAADQ